VKKGKEGTKRNGLWEKGGGGKKSRKPTKPRDALTWVQGAADLGGGKSGEEMHTRGRKNEKEKYETEGLRRLARRLSHLFRKKD